MVAVTDTVVIPDKSQLRHGALSLPETLGQSIANIAPTLTPALNITVVAGAAGVGSWLAYLLATIGCVFVGGSISTLARRHPEAGSYFVYIGRNFGPVTGAMAGWMMVLAYLACAVAVASGFPLFLTAFLAAFGLPAPPVAVLTIAAMVFIGVVAFASYTDVQLSSRVGLVLEIISISIIVIITAIVVAQHGTVIDTKQLNISKLPFGGIKTAMAFAVFSFVGFESAATLAKESANPRRNVPFAVMGSAAAAGTFFTIMAYFMVLGMNDNAGAIGGSGSPFSDMTTAAHLPWASGVVYFAAMISAFACELACLNAGSRMLYSMGRYQFIHSSMGLVHAKHKTPYIALAACTVVVAIAFLALVPQTFINEFNITGTLSTYGFVVVYLGVALTASVDMYKVGQLNAWHIICTVIGAAVMGLVIYYSVIPPNFPVAPNEYLPQVFAAYAVIGLIWFLILKSKNPQALLSIANDMEG